MARANILQDMLAAVVLCIGTAQGTLNAMGWGLAAVFAGMTVLNALTLHRYRGNLTPTHHSVQLRHRCPHSEGHRPSMVPRWTL